MTQTGPLDVLVVEDDDLNLAVVVRLLERTGHRASAVVDGASAISAVQQHRYDVVLMDVEMPGINGIEATKAIRSAGSDVRIIALTGHAGEDQARRCHDAGMEHVLVKPIDARKLECALRRTRPTESGVVQLPLVDLAAAVTRLGGDVELVLEVASRVRADAPKLFEHLAHYVERQLGDETVLTAHSLKGTLSIVNARATHTALRIEQQARKPDWTSVGTLMIDLTRELELLDAALDSAMQELSPVKSAARIPFNEEEADRCSNTS